jgi:hypothetical protein
MVEDDKERYRNGIQKALSSHIVPLIAFVRQRCFDKNLNSLARH